MLEQLTITGGACFGSTPLVLKALQRVNFFFGPNGSGKTTISRALDGSREATAEFVWHDSAPLAIKVYNRDFVTRVLRESSRIPGVFVIGAKSAEAETRLGEIEGDTGERALAVDALRRASSSLARAQTANSDAKTAFLEAAWDAYKAFIEASPSLKPAFTGAGGVGNSKQTLVDRLLTLPVTDQPVPALSDLTSNADAVFSGNVMTESKLAALPAFTLQDHAGFKLLNTKVVGSGTVTLSELVERLGSSDWVARGRSFLHESEGICPFCQQVAPASLVADLATMFDDHYTAQRASIDAFKADFDAWRTLLGAAADAPSLASSAFIDRAAFQTARRELDEAIAANAALLAKKIATPSEAVEFESVRSALEAVNDVIGAANNRIDAHNKLVAGRKTERPLLVRECWRYLAEVSLAGTVSSYEQKQKSRDDGIKTLAEKVTEATDKIAALEDEVRLLQRSVESTRPVIEQINGILERSGFTSFKIVESASLPNGYMLSRGDGEVQEQSLSEGERTFIAFLYYFHLLDGRTEGVDEAARIVAVIDDPISSLDSDVLFVVSALVRHLIARAASETDRIEQVLVFTHNVYFHKEIAHLRQGQSGGGRTFFLIRKRPSSPSTVEASRKNPVETEYGRLWAEVRRAVDGEAMNIIGLENILRRILESYFRVMGGGIWDDEITPLLNAEERHIFQALFRWVNDGSHSVIEDAYYSPSPISQDLYLQVFERVFVATGHEAHYRMMLLGKRSLEDHSEPTPTQAAMTAQ
ncbi:AAA family ATPase [Microbacterium testaceum]|uniref:AAA family ATPase n=1 Tax=Microbacterium testaceum TaxID=2033 RepID=UPI0022E304C3|nr:AAA family ATPase [Microbacterium testaceum]